MKNNAYKLGLVSISFRDKTPLELIKAVRDAGLECIEWGSDVHAPFKDIQRLDDIARLQAEYGITCSSYGTYFHLGETPLEELQDYIAAAKILGTNVLRLWCGKKSADNYSAEERAQFIALCKQAAHIAEQAGAVLCMECHRKTYTQKLSDALYLMNEVNSPSFRMYWQPFQWLSIEQNIDYAENIAVYTEHIHVFQWKDTARFSLYEGVEEWRAYLGKFTTPRTLLLEFMPDDSIASLEREANALKTIIGGLQ